MKKFYPTLVGKVCLTLIILCVFSRIAQAQIRTYDTTFDGWNAIVTEDLSLKGGDSAAGIIFFPGIGQQDKNINDLTVNGPHYLIKNGMWDGSVTLGNGVHHPFIISLQPPAPGSPASVVKPKIDAILARYRIKRNSLYFTALSLGSWQANEFITYQPTPGDRTYGHMVRAMVNLEGVEPSDNTGIYASLPYPDKMGDWAKNCGGRELWVEGAQDWRDMLAGAQNMNAAVPGSATYFQVTYGGGAHCCWNTEYEPNVTWTQQSNSNISQLVGTPVPMNVWQWLLRQGDTSMPGGSPAPPPQTVAPTANAGSAQTITLPTSSVNLTGSGTGNNGAKISTMSWGQTSGPNNSKIKSGNLNAGNGSTMSMGATVSGMEAGNYTFQLTVTDNKNMTSTASVTVTVNPAPAPPPASKPATPPATTQPPAAPPTVSAGGDPTITLPVTTTTLSGTAAGSNGARITNIVWQETQGPVKAKIVSPSGLSTQITGLTTAGTYQFRLTVTDQNGKQSASTVDVVVKPAAAVVTKVPPTVNAGANQTITLPTNSVTLTGKATGNNGAVINSYFWSLVSGPANVKFGNEWAVSTTVSGMVAGAYVFQLSASDNNGQTSKSTVTVTVNPEKPAASNPSTPPPSDPTPPSTPATPPSNQNSTHISLTVNAGKGQEINLPTSTTTLAGTASGTDGAKIVTISWSEISGPVKAKFASPSSLTTEVTGMTQTGSYVFQLIVIDNYGNSANGSMTVTVEGALSKEPGAQPPTVSAGPNETVTLPTSDVTLKGSASGHDGATVNSYFWRLISGPSWVKFGNEWDPGTTVSGYVPGTYVLELSASDDHGGTSASEMTLVVKPKPASPAVNAVETGNTTVDGLTDGLMIYPNPVSDLLNMKMSGKATGKVLVRIFDANGRLIQASNLQKEGESVENAIDVSKLTGGVYILQLVTEGGEMTTRKFVKL